MLKSALYVVLVLAVAVSAVHHKKRVDEPVDASTAYENIVSQMTALQQAYPTMVTLSSIGVNDHGDAIQMMILNKTAKPTVSHLYVGVHHGNEQAAAALGIQLATDFLSGATALDAMELHVIPVLNIDGFNKGVREETDAKGSSHDPNRDYPDACVSQKAGALKSTTALRNYINSTNVVASVTGHGYVGAITYPWGLYVSPSTCDDDAVFAKIGKAAVAINQYETGTSTDVVYPAAGAYEDWCYYSNGVISFLIEMQDTATATVKLDSKAVQKIYETAPTKRSTTHAVHAGQCEKRAARLAYPAVRP